MSSQYLNNQNIQTRLTHLPSYFSQSAVNDTVYFDYIPSSEAFLKSSLEIPVCTVLPAHPASGAGSASSANAFQSFIVFFLLVFPDFFPLLSPSFLENDQSMVSICRTYA